MNRRHCSRRLLLLGQALALALLSSAIAEVAHATSLSLREEALRFEGEKLETDLLFARIDSLESLHAESAGSERALLAHRLAELYLSTDLMKHRRHALSLLDEALSLEPERLESARVRAAMAHRMRYTREAQGWIEEMTTSFDDNPLSHAMLGRFHFLEGRRRMLRPRFEASRDAYEQSVQRDSTFAEGWYGLAAAHLVLEDYPASLGACRALAALDPDREGLILVEAANHVGMGNLAVADSLYELAMAESDETTRAVFQDARGILDERDLEDVAELSFSTQFAAAAMARVDGNWQPGEKMNWEKLLRDDEAREAALREYWRRQDSEPTQLHNPRELAYLRRLVVADLIFGDPNADRRGWNTEMGQALVRWGRPTSTYYDSGTNGNILDELAVAGVQLPIGEAIPQGTPMWIWTYRQPGVWFSLMFTDPTRNARWMMSSDSGYAAEARRRSEPISFFERTQQPSLFQVSMQRAVFHRSDEESVMETYVGIRPLEGFEFAYAAGRAVPMSEGWPPAWSPTDTLGTVEWALYARSGERVDYNRFTLHDRHRRARLHEALGASTWEESYDPFVLPIAARVEPGEYQLAVEVTGPNDVGHESLLLDVEISPAADAGILSMSDLQLASAFRPYSPDSDLPLRYVKFGQGVVPLPDLRVPVSTEDLGVYFELRNLALDLSGRTKFDVTYEVFASSREVRDLAGRPDFAREQLERVDPLTLTFLEESTGVSSEGVVVKGAQVDIETLRRGDYVLVVTVHDRVAKRTESRAVSFRKIG